MPEMYADEEYAAAVDRAWSEAEVILGAPMDSNHPVEKVVEVLKHASFKTYLYSDDLTADEAAWKLLYNELLKGLRAANPDLAAKIDEIQEKNRPVAVVQRALEARQKANLTDWGFRVPLGFMIVGGLIGFFRSPDLRSVIVGGLVSWFAGLLFSIFVLDSADIQIKWAFRLHGKPGLTWIANWLFSRTLKRFAPENNEPKPPPIPPPLPK